MIPLVLNHGDPEGTTPLVVDVFYVDEFGVPCRKPMMTRVLSAGQGLALTVSRRTAILVQGMDIPPPATRHFEDGET